MESNEYRCAMCDEVFTKAWSDEEAHAEAETNGFGNVAPEDMAVVCDDCYVLLKPFLPM